jgi:hypothetical protein
MQRRIMLKQMAEPDVMRFIRIGVIRAATQELPIAVLADNQKNGSLAPKDVAAAVHAQARIIER